MSRCCWSCCSCFQLLEACCTALSASALRCASHRAALPCTNAAATQSPDERFCA
jgi:hypothetical protein